MDIVIHPDYQVKGVGKKVVNELKNRLDGYNFITLTAAPNKEGFYRKLGWKKQKSAFIFPKTKNKLKNIVNKTASNYSYKTIGRKVV